METMKTKKEIMSEVEKAIDASAPIAVIPETIKHLIEVLIDIRDILNKDNL